MKGFKPGQPVFFVNISKCKIQEGHFVDFVDHELQPVMSYTMPKQSQFMIKSGSKLVRITFDTAQFSIKQINPVITQTEKAYLYSRSSVNCGNNTYLFFSDEKLAKETLKNIVIPIHIEKAEEEAEHFQSQYMERVNQVDALQKLAETL